MCSYEVQGEVTIMRFADGRTAVIDTADLALVSLRKWSMNAKGRINTSGSRTKPTVPLGRYLLGLTARWEFADHVSGDASDNRRCNLRKATPSQNRANTGRRCNTRAYKGVYRNRSGDYVARLTISESGYATAEEAAEAYDRMATRYYGGFARLNQGQSAAKPLCHGEGSTTRATARSLQVDGETGTALPN